MADIQTTFTSDSKQIEAVYERLKRMDLEQLERHRQLHEQTKKNADAVGEWTAKQAAFISDIPKMALGLVGVEKAVGFITDGFTRMNEKIADAVNRSRDFTREMAKSAGLTSDAARLDTIKAAFAGQAKAGVPLDLSQQFFAGARDTAGMLSTDERLKLYARAAPLLATVNDPGGFGRQVGSVAQFTGLGQASVGLAAGIDRLAGSPAAGAALTSDDMLRSIDALQRSGAIDSREQGFATGIELQRAHLPPNILARMAAVVSEHQVYKRPSAGQPFTEVDRAFNKFAGAKSEAEKWKLLTSDPLAAEAMLGVKAAEIRGVNWQGVAGDTAALRASELPDAIDRIRAEFAGTGPGREALRGSGLAALKDTAQLRIAAEHAQWGIGKSFRESIIDDLSPEERSLRLNPYVNMASQLRLGIFGGTAGERESGMALRPEESATYDRDFAAQRPILESMDRSLKTIAGGAPPPVVPRGQTEGR